MVSGGVVYVGNNEGKLFALEAASGALKWRAVVGGPIVSAPAVKDGHLYFTSQDGKIYCARINTRR